MTANDSNKIKVTDIKLCLSLNLFNNEILGQVPNIIDFQL